MAEELSAADRASLQSEVGPVNMAVGGVLVAERGPGTTADAIAERLAARLHLIPRYRQRLEELPLGLGGTAWADDPHFDLHWHVRGASLPAPAGMAQLEELVAREMSRRLDRSRPLWEIVVVEEVEGDRSAVLAKMHHALVDGIAAVGVALLLLDPQPEPIEYPPPETEDAPVSGRRGRLDLLQRLAAAPAERVHRLLLEATTRALEATPRRAAEDVKRATGLVGELARSRPQAPATPLNAPLSPNRRFATLSAPLDELKRAGKAAGGTVNDALLAAVAGMLRRYLGEAAGGRSPVALVPVSVRPQEAEGKTGNHVSTVFVDLPAGEPDPTERIRLVGAEMRELRGSAAVQAGALVASAAGWVPPLLSSVLVRATGSVRAFNLVVSNVPGPQQPFYLNGSRVLEVYPVVPLNPANQRLTVGILSYDGVVHVGLLADAALDPGIEVARDALAAALDEVIATA